MADKPLNLTIEGHYPVKLVSGEWVFDESVQGSQVETDLAWTNNDAYTYIEIDYKIGAGAWNALTDVWPGDRAWYQHDCSDFNATLSYRVRGYAGAAWSDYTDTVTIEHYLDTATETVTGSDIVVDGTGGTGQDFFTETITMTDTATDGSAYGQINSETITMTDTLEDSFLNSTNVAHYVGSAAGTAYRYSSDYYGDAGSVIRSFWKSKKLDFFDQYPQFLDAWKTLYRIKMIYVDKSADTSVTLYLSTDGGVTTTTQTKTLGNGDGTTKETYFYMIKTGRYFNFWIEHVSATNAFQWLSLEAEFTPSGDFFPMS